MSFTTNVKRTSPGKKENATTRNKEITKCKNSPVKANIVKVGNHPDRKSVV